MEVVIKSLKSHPCCPHGPTLMFERYTSDGRKTGRRFFACSACRDRNDCSFFHWVDDHISAQCQEHWKYQINRSRPPFTHGEYMQRLISFKNLPVESRIFCRTCSMLLLLEEELHSSHDVLHNINTELDYPSSMLVPLKNNKVEAQYFFSENTVQFVVQLIQRLSFTRVICIGTPKIHEYISARQLGVTSILLDIDYRYMQFYNNEQFCHYNLFNNCFFGGLPAKEVFKKFLCEDDGNNLVIVLDPPFGGLVDAIAYTLRKITAWWRRGSKKENEEELPLLLFFPYFNENRILESIPKLKMMDYKVEYLNHKGFKERKRGSPVRIFTNIDASALVLPESEGYRFCDICKRYVWKENQHCQLCKACTTKDGKTYKHCALCKRCVKSSYEHCYECGKCVLAHHKCEEVSKVIVCRFCSGVGHKNRDCPLKSEPPKKKIKTV